MIRKVSPLQRDSPSAQRTIWDTTLQKRRHCKNELERLRATKEFHNKWMSNSKANVTCAFVNLMVEDGLGVRGVELTPDRKVTLEDVPDLVYNGQNLPYDIQTKIVDAHGPHIAELFCLPKEDKEIFSNPYYLTSAQGTMNDEDKLLKDLTPALLKIPGKARFDGFQLAVLGRFAKVWRTVLFKIIKLILVMRYVPDTIKSIARYPIPKPGRPNETRPISLCHDLYCTINGFMCTSATAAMERDSTLQQGIATYRKGHGSAPLVGIEINMREDCREGGSPASQIDEDEEKFFDRIPLVISLAAMRTNGFPEEGFVELKANCMGTDKIVQILTDIGIVTGQFNCGIEQGNPYSPRQSNLVIKNKLICGITHQNRLVRIWASSMMNMCLIQWTSVIKL